MTRATDRPLRIAFQKGRLLPEIVQLWQESKFDVPDDLLFTRKLLLPSSDGRFQYILAKHQDIPFLLASQTADLGIVGQDLLLEAGEDLVSLLDLGLGKGRLCLCGHPNKESQIVTSIATCYPNLAWKVMQERNLQGQVLKFGGSLELSVQLGLADSILDLVETGKSLEENGLVIFEEIAQVSTRLATSQTTWNQRGDEIIDFLTELEVALTNKKMKEVQV